MPPAADGDGGDAEGEWDVGVGGAEAGFGAEVEVTVDGAEAVASGESCGKSAGGAVADAAKVIRGDSRRLCASRVRPRGLRPDALGERGEDEGFEVVELLGEVERRSRSQVAEEGMELTEVPPAMVAELRVVRGLEGRVSCVSSGSAAARIEDGVGAAGVGPGVAAGAGDVDAETAAGQGAGDDRVGAPAFERDGGGDAMGVGAGVEEMAHAAEVALAFFAYVGGEEDGHGRGDSRLGLSAVQRGGDGEQSGEAGGVVAGSGAEDARSSSSRGACSRCRRGRWCRGGRRGG